MRDWLRDARKNRGMTMRHVADELGISESYYCSIENGYRKKDLDLSLAYKLSKLLRVPLKSILSFEQENRITNDVR